MSKAWAGGSTSQSRKFRADILDRDQHLCRLRYEHCTTAATEVHHLDGKANGDDPNRAMAVCRRCHSRESGQQTIQAVAQFPRAKRTPERHPGLL
ncbi:HNH endonuclease [Mycobacteroides abscessus]|uniref:HNH endonuclease n=1 Tax=Mycobacteroides abscessus TaxID=36809 RepID=UPI0010426A36|nr:HNH endonuclease signature motif containing protein [Mycobacteroides abscessus]